MPREPAWDFVAQVEMEEPANTPAAKASAPANPETQSQPVALQHVASLEAQATYSQAPVASLEAWAKASYVASLEAQAKYSEDAVSLQAQALVPSSAC